MKCPKCQAANPEEAQHCIVCGVKLPLPSEVFCTHCGANNPTGSRFCLGCGRSLAKAPPAPSSRGILSKPFIGVVIVVLVVVVALVAVTAHNSQSQPNINLFANPNEPAFVPGKGFAPDTRRILELASLQVSLEKYYIVKGVHPHALADLFPTFAPKVNGSLLAGPPLDPGTQQPYDYQLSANGKDYQLTVILVSGKQYSVNRANLRRYAAQ